MAHRHRKKSHDEGIEIVLPITPMLDMSFQLLAFFVFTFKPVDKLEGQMDMFLPKAGTPAAKTPEEAKPFEKSESEIDLQNAAVVRVESLEDANGKSTGAIGKISIKEKEGSTEVPRDQLKARLKKFQESAENKTNIKIEASSGLKYSFLVEVMDACLQAGFKSVGFEAPIAETK